MKSGIDFLVVLFDVAGLVVIFWGVGAGLRGFVSALHTKVDAAEYAERLTSVRCRVGTNILLGLEMMIASDIARTVVEPTVDSLIFLFATVVIRAMLSLLLSRELAGIGLQK